jgi:TolB-like protein
MVLVIGLVSAGVSNVAAAKDTLAVLYFESSEMNPELSGLKVGLAQMLITDLAGSGEFTVVEREQLQAILDEQKLGHEGITEPGTAAKIGKLLGAQKMLMGGYFKLGATFRVDARLVDVETSKIIASKGVNGRVEEFLAIEAQLADFTRDAMVSNGRVRGGSSTVPTSTRPAPAPAPTPAPAGKRDGNDGSGDAGGSGSGDAVAIAAPDPKAIEAAMAFSDGLIFMDAGDEPKARESFEKAIAASDALEDAKTALAKLSL